MKVYEAERGLAARMLSRRSLSLVAEVVLREPGGEPQADPAAGPGKEKKFFSSLAKTSADQPDLLALDTVLVSTGWNRNDDVFGLAETWAARHSPEDKPFNYEHDESDIIGHITGNRCVAEDGSELPDDGPAPTAPFHVVTSCVLYRLWQDEKLQARMDDIVREVAEGRWYVSMECLFGDFDFALEEVTTGAQRAVARNADTAFLTKHLRAYGGSGTYQNHRVGRLLRDIVFTGKGLVRRPANPDSVILGPARGAAFAAATLEPVYEAVMAERESEMADETLKKEAERLSQENERAQADLKAAREEAARLKAESEAARAAAEEAGRRAAELEKNLSEANREIDSLKAEKRLKERLSQAAKALSLPEDQVKGIVDATAQADDAAFAAHLEAVASVAKAYPKSSPAPDPTYPPNRHVKTVRAALENAEPAKDNAPEVKDPAPDGEAVLFQAVAAYLGAAEPTKK